MKTRPRVDQALIGRVQALLARRDQRPLPHGHARPQMKITAQAEGAELMIYDEISYWGVCATDVAAALTTLTGPLHVRINSPGGDVFDGIAIYNMLADYPGTVTVTVDGLAASAASFIAMAGDRVVMNRAAQMMVHDASGMCWGNAADMKAMAALLDQVSSTLAGIYAARSGVDPDTWRARMLADGDGTWYTAEGAVEAGLADELVPHPSREGQDQPGPAMDMAASLFPYGTADREGRWRLAALAPQAATQTPAGAPGGPQPDTDPPAPETPSAVAQAPRPEPVPAPPAPASGAADEWGQLIEQLLEPPAPPSADDLLASLREAM